MMSVMLAEVSFSLAVYTGGGKRRRRERERGETEGSEVGFGEAGDCHLMFEEAEFERVVAVDRDDDAFAMAGFGENMVAAVDAGEVPAALL